MHQQFCFVLYLTGNIWVLNFTSAECGRNKRTITRQNTLEVDDLLLPVEYGRSDVVFLATSKESTKKAPTKSKSYCQEL